jgi:predicted aspartyl protease
MIIYQAVLTEIKLSETTSSYGPVAPIAISPSAADTATEEVLFSRPVVRRALLDTGATRVHITRALADLLDLRKVGKEPSGFLGGKVEMLPIYEANVAFEGHAGHVVTVMGDFKGKVEFEILVGQEFLSHYIFTLNGPTRNFTVSDDPGP